MQDCSGSFSGVVSESGMSGTWLGRYDEGPLDSLIREKADWLNTSLVTVKDTTVNINASVIGQYSIVQDLSVQFGNWKGTGTYHNKTWSDIAHQIDLINQQTSQILVDITNYHNNLENKVAQVNQICTNIINILRDIESGISSVTDLCNDIKSGLKQYGKRVIGCVLAGCQVLFEPLFRVCKPGQTDIARVDIDDDLRPAFSRSPSLDGVGYVTFSSYNDGGSISILARDLAAYGNFNAWLGSGHYYYSDELAQVLARPYRYNDNVQQW